MSNAPLVNARRFEAFVRWSTYLVVSLPAGSLLRNATESQGFSDPPAPALVAAGVLCLVLVIGNILVTRWSIDAVVGRARRLPPAGVLVWGLVLAAFVPVVLAAPLPDTGMTVAAAIGSVAASLAPALDARRTLLLNAAIVALALPLAGVARLPLLLTGTALITVVLWACWSTVWMLRVLRELQAAHESRAALALANERLRISRDLHDVFGRTLAAIALKSSLASELVRRGHEERAAAEITAVRRLAEEAGTEVRNVVRGELDPTWDDEVSGARSLLESAGIRCTVSGDPVPEECGPDLARVVREGVTNLLRHSAATRVTLAVAHEDGEVSLTISNDGIGAAAVGPGTGTGLRTMSERIGALGGRVTTHRDGDWFLLDAALPIPRGNPA